MDAKDMAETDKDMLSKLTMDDLDRPCDKCSSLYGEHSAISKNCPSPYRYGSIWLNITFTEKVTK